MGDAAKHAERAMMIGELCVLSSDIGLFAEKLSEFGEAMDDEARAGLEISLQSRYSAGHGEMSLPKLLGLVYGDAEKGAYEALLYMAAHSERPTVDDYRKALAHARTPEEKIGALGFILRLALMNYDEALVEDAMGRIKELKEA
jgi:hypothetical protein